MNTFQKFTWILVLLFVAFTILFIAATPLLTKWDIDNKILLSGNALLFIINLIVFSIQRKALQNSNPNVFVRSVMGGMMIKLFTIATAVMVYALANRGHFNKAAVLIFLVLYIVYQAVEITAIMKLNKKPDA